MAFAYLHLIMTGGPDTESLNRAFDLLRNPRRRYVLYYLTNSANPEEMDTLATHLATWEANDTETTVTDDAIREISVSLHHLHLPKLADAGLIRFASNPGIVELVGLNGLDTFLADTASIEWDEQAVADD